MCIRKIKQKPPRHESDGWFFAATINNDIFTPMEKQEAFEEYSKLLRDAVILL